MPNYCDYNMKIKGTRENVLEVIKCLETDYDYGTGKPSHKHFFRVFDCYYDETDFEENEDGTITAWVSGYCAWSVYSCMCDGEHSYYNDIKKSHPDTCMGISLAEASRDYHCLIEVFSEETGMCFSEHYVFLEGECLCDECVELQITEEDEYGDYQIINEFCEYEEDGDGRGFKYSMF